jgi:low affinity Fe/Cu permease
MKMVAGEEDIRWVVPRGQPRPDPLTSRLIYSTKQNAKASRKIVDWFFKLSRQVEHTVGSPWTFCVALLIVVVWAVTGPLFDFSDTWQLVINTGTTIVTFLMVFLIQSTQTRDTQALHVKLDELIRVDRQARNELVNLEDKTDEEITLAKDTFRGIEEENEEQEYPKDRFKGFDRFSG